jgi:hypothetical protein
MDKMGSRIDEAIDRKLPSAVHREIQLLSRDNPKKIIKGRLGLLERLKRIFK